MKLIKTKDYDEMSMKAAQIIINKVRQNESATLGFATGGTPIGTYDLLIKDFKQNCTSYEQINSINLDEYVGLHSTHPSSYRYFMHNQLFKHINISPENIYFPDGTAEDLQLECERFENVIQNLGGIDLQLLGVGQNGHIGFNEPGTPFHSVTHVVELTENTRKVNSRFFNHINEVPYKAITMGISSILKSKHILLLVSGEEKAEVMQRLLSEDVHDQLPVSVLKKHPHFTVICDEKALKGVKV